MDEEISATEATPSAPETSSDEGLPSIDAILGDIEEGSSSPQEPSEEPAATPTPPEGESASEAPSGPVETPSSAEGSPEQDEVAARRARFEELAAAERAKREMVQPLEDELRQLREKVRQYESAPASSPRIEIDPAQNIFSQLEKAGITVDSLLTAIEQGDANPHLIPARVPPPPPNPEVARLQTELEQIRRQQQQFIEQQRMAAAAMDRQQREQRVRDAVKAAVNTHPWLPALGDIAYNAAYDTAIDWGQKLGANVSSLTDQDLVAFVEERFAPIYNNLRGSNPASSIPAKTQPSRTLSNQANPPTSIPENNNFFSGDSDSDMDAILRFVEANS